jgi:hypothetical protein
MAALSGNEGLSWSPQIASIPISFVGKLLILNFGYGFESQGAFENYWLGPPHINWN